MHTPDATGTQPALEVIMPMAGLGSRFTATGVSVPKPLIEVDGVPMFLRALRSIDAYRGEVHATFVIRQESETRFALGSTVDSLVPGSSILTIDQLTRGAAETALLAAEATDPASPVLVLDCDLAFDAPGYVAAMASAAQEGHPDGLLLSFTSADPQYSYAAVDADGYVTATAEKRVISAHALIGAYYFRECRTLVRLARELLTRPAPAGAPEYYMSMLFDELARSGGRVRLLPGRFDSFGTPEELAARRPA